MSLWWLSNLSDLISLMNDFLDGLTDGRAVDTGRGAAVVDVVVVLGAVVVVLLRGVGRCGAGGTAAVGRTGARCLVV